jgi:methionine aminotransferase
MLPRMSVALTSKLPGFGTTIFTVMSKLASEHGAINLSQGFPDFEGPQELRDRIAWHMDHGHNQYAPMPGLPVLQEQIAAKVADLYGAAVDPDTQVAVTPGATEAIHCAVTAVVNPGDEVIIVDPAYDTYDPCVRLNHGVPVHVPMTTGDFRIDWARVRDAISGRTRMIMLNSPHNPTGSVIDAGDIEALREVIGGRDIFIMSDEVYEHILFDGHDHSSMLRYPDLAERAFVVSSFGKTYHATGWRIGYCVAPPALMREFIRIHQFINFSTNTPMQYGIADYLRDHPEHHRELGAFYQYKRDLFCTLMADSLFEITPAGGTYFQLADYGEISDLEDTDFARWLTVEHGVAAIPISVFYRQPPKQRVVRFCFAKDDETLRAAAEILNKL